MATSLAKQAMSALNREKPHSSITDWIEILTSSRYEVEAYDGIPEVVDSINLQASGPAEASRSLRKKLKHGDDHHKLRALVILKALVENCGTNFQTSFANDRLTEAIRNLAADPATDPDVKKKLFVVLASWKRQFHDDPKMKLVASLFDQCRPHTRRSEDFGATSHSEEIAARERERELEREREREREKEERETAKRLREEAKLAKEQAKREKEEERERKLREAKRPKQRRAFNLEQEKPQVLTCIATASQCSSNLVNALMLANPQQEPVEINARVQECLGAAKKVRKELIRYIQLVEDEELIGALLETNERIIQALDTYDKYLIPDGPTADTGLESQLSTTALADGNGSVPELTKLQEKQRAAVVRAQKSQSRSPTISSGSNVHPDLQDLSFGALGSDAARLPPPLQPSSPDSPIDDDNGRRGSLSDFSSYTSSDEETHNRRVVTTKGRGRGFSAENSDAEGASRPQPLLIDDSDPFADPV